MLWVPPKIVVWIYDTFDDNFRIENEGELWVMFWLTFLHQKISWLCFCLHDFIKSVSLLLVAAIINELNWLEHEAHTSTAELGLMMKFQDCDPCISKSLGNYGTWSRLVSYSRHLLFKRKCPIYQHLNLTLPMLRLLKSKAQGHKDFRKTSKPCHVGIHHIALAEYW